MRIKLLALAALLACAVGGPLRAANLLVNGDFELVNMTNGNAQHSTIIGDGITDVTLPTATGWTTKGWNFVMMNNPSYPGRQTLTGADDQNDSAYTTANPAGARLGLWGPDAFSSAANGMTNSPTGGSFLAADGAFKNRPVEQVLTGLTVGKQYQLTFWWAGAQQRGFNGITTDGWKICFGTCSYTANDAVNDSYAVFNNVSGQDTIFSTNQRTNPNHGFLPWQYEYFQFTATSSTQTLSLLAYGTPLGQPPFSLIDGLQLDAVPEPTTWAMMLLGFGVIGGVMRTRRQPLASRRGLNAQIV